MLPSIWLFRLKVCRSFRDMAITTSNLINNSRVKTTSHTPRNTIYQHNISMHVRVFGTWTQLSIDTPRPPSMKNQLRIDWHPSKFTNCSINYYFFPAMSQLHVRPCVRTKYNCWWGWSITVIQISIWLNDATHSNTSTTSNRAVSSNIARIALSLESEKFPSPEKSTIYEYAVC